MPALPMFLVITNRQTFGEQYKRERSSLCYFLQFFTSYFLVSYVLLTVHLSIILVINQLNAQILVL